MTFLRKKKILLQNGIATVIYEMVDTDKQARDKVLMLMLVSILIGLLIEFVIFSS